MTTMTQPKQTYKRGDVALVLFPHSDLRTAKTRPALVVQADNLQTGLPQVIVAMITSRMLRAAPEPCYCPAFETRRIAIWFAHGFGCHD